MPPSVEPWYKHRWPWILMSGPAIVVVAGIATTIIAIRSDDGLVAKERGARPALEERNRGAAP